MYDPGLAARLDDIMAGMLEMETTQMFGGYGFLMNGHMCVGIWNDTLVIRIGADGWDAISGEPHVRPMDLTGRVMKGWAMIEPEGVTRTPPCSAISTWPSCSVPRCRRSRGNRPAAPLVHFFQAQAEPVCGDCLMAVMSWPIISPCLASISPCWEIISPCWVIISPCHHLTMFDKHVLLLGTGGSLFFNQGKQPGVPVVGYAAKVMKILRQGRQIDIKHIDLPTQLFNP